tara:strand:- start:2372 stop:4462 length:2091 start_codon:yes stop_codon:yes gene_type:complete
MKRHIIFIALLVFSFLNACDQEELSPRTNPRFSIAYIQELDDSGAEFVSNIYDFGSDEITEYGFLYSLNSYPTLSNSEIISQQGKPEKEFTLKAKHSLVKGKVYAVVAYIQTTSERVYSEPFGFVSQGAPGFIFERFEYKSPVFHGDTITVWGSNMSQLHESYAVNFQDKEATIVNIEENAFKFIVPEFSNFNNGENGPDSFNITLQVLDKKLDMNAIFPFQNAEFEERDTQFIDYGGSVEILGKYLQDINLKIVTSPDVPERIYGSNVSIESAENNKIVFTPNPKYAGINNNLTLEIRGKLYAMGTDFFAFNPPEINSNQHLLIQPFENFTIKGHNFNTAAARTHKAIVNGHPVSLEGFTTDAESLTFRIADLESFYMRTNNVMKIKTFDQFSEETITFEFTNPDFPYMQNPYATTKPSGYWNWKNMVGYGEKGYALGNHNIFEFDIDQKSVHSIHQLPNEISQLQFTFGVLHGEKWYIGGGINAISNTVNQSFFVFNLRTKELRRLPDLPFYEKESVLAHAFNGYLYFEGGIVMETGNDHKNRYKFNLQTEEWIRLPDKEFGREYIGRTIAFEHKEKQFALGDPDGSLIGHFGLFEFDPIRERWKLLKQFDGLNYSSIKTDQVFILGNNAYLLGSSMRVLNLGNYEIRQVTNFAFSDLLNYNYYRNMAFMSRGDIYILDRDSHLWEIDLEKLTY